MRRASSRRKRVRTTKGHRHDRVALRSARASVHYLDGTEGWEPDAIACDTHSEDPCRACGGSGRRTVEHAAQPGTDCSWCDGTGVRVVYLSECLCTSTAEALGAALPTYEGHQVNLHPPEAS